MIIDRDCSCDLRRGVSDRRRLAPGIDAAAQEGGDRSAEILPAEAYVEVGRGTPNVEGDVVGECAVVATVDPDTLLGASTFGDICRVAVDGD